LDPIAALAFTGNSQFMELPLDDLGVRPTATEGEPAESIGRLHVDGGGELGVWECKPGRIPVVKDGVSEYMVLLRGHAVIHSADGTSVEVRPGDSFVAPDGWQGEWEIRETVRKVYVLWKTAPAA
jgi:hypothetical protein